MTSSAEADQPATTTPVSRRRFMEPSSSAGRPPLSQESSATAQQEHLTRLGFVLWRPTGSCSSGGNGSSDGPPQFEFTSLSRKHLFLALAALAVVAAACLGGIAMLVDDRINHALAGQMKAVRRELRSEVQAMHAQYQMRLQDQAASAATAAILDGEGFQRGGKFSTLVFGGGSDVAPSPTDDFVAAAAPFESRSAVAEQDQPHLHRRRLPENQSSTPKTVLTRTVWDELCDLGIGTRIGSGLVDAAKTGRSFFTGAALLLLKNTILSLVLLLVSVLTLLLKALAGDEASAAVVKPIIVAVAIAAMAWFLFGGDFGNKAIGKRKSLKPQGSNGRSDPIGHQRTSRNNAGPVGHQRTSRIDAGTVGEDETDDGTWSCPRHLVHSSPSSRGAGSVPPNISVVSPRNASRGSKGGRSSTVRQKPTAKLSSKRDQRREAHRLAEQAYREGRLGR